MSGIWLPDCSKLAINQKNDNAVFLLSSLVIGPSFMSISLYTDSRDLTIFFHKGLTTRNQEIRNTPA